MASMIGTWCRSATRQVKPPYWPSPIDPKVLGLEGNGDLGVKLPGSKHPLDANHRRTWFIRARTIRLPRDNGTFIQGVLQLDEPR